MKSKSIQDPVWKDYYWIDFVKLCKQFIPGGDLIFVKYFTAPPSDDGKRSRQSALLKANELLNPEKFIIINGNYQSKSITCKKCRKTSLHPEEKRTDVNISVNMMLDCFNDKADTFVLISADSDQVPTIQAIKENFPTKNIKIYFPPNRKSTELFSILNQVVYLEKNESKFRSAVMSNEVVVGSKKFTCPLNWKS